MNDDALQHAELLKQELLKAIKHRKRCEKLNFYLAHCFLWVSILASFGSALIIAADNLDYKPILIAVIAGIPGLVVAIEKTFDFAKRSAWDTVFKLDLQELNDEIAFGEIGTLQAAKRLREITRRNEAAFLNIGFFKKDGEQLDNNVADEKSKIQKGSSKEQISNEGPNI